MYGFREKYEVGGYAWNREMARIDAEREGRGRRNFDNLSLVANASIVPENFYEATQNLNSEVDYSSLTATGESRKKILNSLLGFELKSRDDALYVWHLGRSISLIKKLRNSIPNSTEQVELRKPVLSEIGMSEFYKERVIRSKSFPLSEVGIRTKKAINHAKSLGDQLEQQFSDDQVKERVTLLAQPKDA